MCSATKARWSGWLPTFRGLDANLLEPIGFLHGPHNRLDQLLDLLVQPAHISVLLRGFSSTSMAFTRLSYSAGRVSRMRYESLLTPMRSAGFSLSESTRPMSGKKIVCRVDVLMTADLPTLVASRSMFAPSSRDSAVGSRSSSSTTLPTR